MGGHQIGVRLPKRISDLSLLLSAQIGSESHSVPLSKDAEGGIFRIIGAPGEIRIEHLQNTSLECYC
jgi:hypothetical protein